MKKKVLDQWLTDLRSGQFNQTTGVLIQAKVSSPGEPDRPVGHCCLGVLTEQFIREGVLTTIPYGSQLEVGYPQDKTVFDFVESFGTKGMYATLRSNFTENECGMTKRETEILQTLMNMNDEGRSFAEIAEVIEIQFKPTD